MVVSGSSAFCTVFHQIERERERERVEDLNDS